jgi:hypothetical protein
MKSFLNTAIKNTLKSTLSTTVVIAASSVLWLNSAYAHDASMHKKDNAEKPKCEAMKDMDYSKMDMNDPIIQAMMKQCMASEHHETKTEKHEDNGHHGDMKKPH